LRAKRATFFPDEKQDISIPNSDKFQMTNSRNKKIILCDMDNCVVDFDTRFMERWNEKGFGDAAAQVVPKREKFELEENFSNPEDAARANEIMAEAGFYFMLRANPGAIEALKQMKEAGHEVSKSKQVNAS
jgi:FMN phosphatase YigB (HAD superfamily)